MTQKIHLLQVDQILYESCQTNGEYCLFNTRFLKFLADKEKEDWFADFIIPHEFEWKFEDDKWKQVPKKAEFLAIEDFTFILREVIDNIQSEGNQQSTDKTTQLLEGLEKYNFSEAFSMPKVRRKRQGGPKPGGGGPGGGGPGGFEQQEAVSYDDIITISKRFHVAATKMIDKFAKKKKRKRQTEGIIIFNNFNSS